MELAGDGADGSSGLAIVLNKLKLSVLMLEMLKKAWRA
jgi:hypothetical protein